MTKKKLSPEEEAAIRALRDRLVMTIRYFENAQEFPSGAQMRAIVEDAAARQDRRTLRLLGREVENMTIALAPHQRDGLETMLHDRLGINQEAERAELKRQIAAVIARGTVRSEKERRRLEDYAETLEVTGGDPAEIEAVRRLLSAS